MKETKSIFSNKMFLLALFSFIVSIISLISVGYAWLVTIKENKIDSFVATVGESGYDFQFSQVIDDKIVQTDTYVTDKTMPGEVNIFILKLSNASNNPCLLDVFFYNVHSEKYNSELGLFDSDYTDKEYEKIQYSYSYCCNLIVNVPNDTEINETEGEIIHIPTDDEILELGWEKVGESSNNAKEDTYFNVIENNVERSNYYLLSDFVLDSESTILVYFTVKFQPNNQIPTIYQEIIPSNISFDEQFYSNQRFVISNLMIENKSDKND